jgi:hypothetical protein
MSRGRRILCVHMCGIFLRLAAASMDCLVGKGCCCRNDSAWFVQGMQYVVMGGFSENKLMRRRTLQKVCNSGMLATKDL